MAILNFLSETGMQHPTLLILDSTFPCALHRRPNVDLPSNPSHAPTAFSKSGPNSIYRRDLSWRLGTAQKPTNGPMVLLSSGSWRAILTPPSSSVFSAPAAPLPFSADVAEGGVAGVTASSYTALACRSSEAVCFLPAPTPAAVPASSWNRSLRPASVRNCVALLSVSKLHQ